MKSLFDLLYREPKVNELWELDNGAKFYITKVTKGHVYFSFLEDSECENSLRWTKELFDERFVGKVKR